MIANSSKGARPVRHQAVGWSLAGVLLVVGTSATAEPVRFNEQIRPILAENCLNCHGPDARQREADLRLDRPDSAYQTAIVPNDPDASELLRRITADEGDGLMPPPDSGDRLSPAEADAVRQWISQGAVYDRHWAFEPITRPDPPAVDGEEGLPAIDRFIVAKLKEQGLTLSPVIDRRELIRRATFDLTGLPPTWAEVEAFVNDTSPQAFERVIDRLLASPQYGERWGRHWLDLARYADTHGGSAIGFTRFAFSYTYRDYVIAAFNADVPYDRFVLEQLAADQLGLEENDPAHAALGFLTVGMQYRNPHDVVDDQIDVVTRGLLGLTVACARCHDHKYDEVSTKDYYSLYATLANSDVPDSLPIVGAPPDTDAYGEYRKELHRRQVVSEDMARDQSAVMRGRLRMQVGLYLRELAKGTPEQDLSSAFLSYRTDDLRPLVLNRWRDYLAGLPEDDPVFGPWLRLARISDDEFEQASAAVIKTFKEENGDPEKFPQMHLLASAAPKWNPRVLDTLQDKQPKSMLDVADAYGELFAEVHRQWLRALLAAAEEAAPGGSIITDQDPRHTDVNSAVNNQLRRHLYQPGTPTAMPDDVAVTLLNRTVRDTLTGKQGAIHELHLNSPGSPPRAMVLEESPEPQAYHVMNRGNPIDRGDPVEPRFLSALTEDNPPVFPDGQRRLGLARAILAADNPLTRRVIVNWVWQHHFGEGIVRTPDDFGTRGEPPTHPELLDWLASVFAEDGWSLKKLHRRIMLTTVYRQGAIEDPASREKDPENRWLWRMPRRRLELEPMRDAMLAISGELDRSQGGRPFDLLSEPVVPRRSVYAFINRDIISSLASTFDGANPASCTARRDETTVPQQTLFALNSTFIQDRAAAFAAIPELAAIEDNTERIRWMYRRALSRSPGTGEIEQALQFIEEQPGEDRWAQLAHVLLAANEFVFVD